MIFELVVTPASPDGRAVVRWAPLLAPVAGVGSIAVGALSGAAHVRIGID